MPIDKQAFLSSVLGTFNVLSDRDIADSLPLWRSRTIRKGDFFNMQNVVCNDLGLVIKGIFRVFTTTR
jgi:hypothetical protein